MHNICYFVNEKTNSYDYNMFLQICKKVSDKVKLNLIVVRDKEVDYIKNNSLNYIFGKIEYVKNIKSIKYSSFDMPVVTSNMLTRLSYILTDANTSMEMTEENILEILFSDNTEETHKTEEIFVESTTVTEQLENSVLDELTPFDDCVEQKKEEPVKKEEPKTIHPKKVKVKKN